MKPLVVGAAVGGLVLVAGAVALLPKEEPIEVLPPAPAPQPAPAPAPEPVIEPVADQPRFDGPGPGGPFGDMIRQYTTEFDRDGDGVLNEEERRAAWEAFEKRQLAQWDKDGDGVLSDEERRAGMEAMIRERTEAEMTRRFDRDGDGQLNDQERAAMEAQRAEREQRRQQWELEQYDLNKDGIISDTERTEVDTQRRERQARFQQAVTARFDSDGDGQMSRLEWQAAGQTMRQEMRDARTARMVDANGDGIADANDLASWAQKIAAGDMGADFNRDGLLDQRDMQWASDAIATASTRRVDPAWEALMGEMMQGNGMRMMMGGPGGPGGPGGGDRQFMRVDGGPGMVIIERSGDGPQQGNPPPQTAPAPPR